MRLARKVVKPTSGRHSASVIFFHGCGDTGPIVAESIRNLLGKDMEFPHIKMIYPTAPAIPYTPFDKEPTHVWFDREAISINARENGRLLWHAYQRVHELLVEELKLKISPERIIVGGFSMGGALAIHAGFYLETFLKGVFACSAFLNRDSIVYDSLAIHKKHRYKLPELKMFHGSRDRLVPLEWAQESFRELTKLGVKGELTVLENTEHEMTKRALEDIEKWIKKKLRPLASDARRK